MVRPSESTPNHVVLDMNTIFRSIFTQNELETQMHILVSGIKSKTPTGCMIGIDQEINLLLDESLENEAQLNKVAIQVKLKLMSAKVRNLKKKATKLINDRKKLIARLKRNLGVKDGGIGFLSFFLFSFNWCLY